MGAMRDHILINSINHNLMNENNNTNNSIQLNEILRHSLIPRIALDNAFQINLRLVLFLLFHSFLVLSFLDLITFRFFFSLYLVHS